MAQSNVQIQATANTTQATQQMQNLGNATENVRDSLRDVTEEGSRNGSSIGSLASRYAGAVAAITSVALAFRQVYKAASECVQLYIPQEKAEARLKAVLNATGSQLQSNASDLIAYASELEKLTNLGSETIVEAEKLLVATKALNDEGLKRTLDLSADIAVAMGTDITSAAQMMARALQDPVSGLRGLRSASISFTNAEQDQIRAMVEANNLAGAQELVLTKVEGAYKGVAEAIKETDAGKLETISTSLGNIKKNLGKAILDEISPALEWVIEKLGYIEEWSEKIKNRTSITSTIRDNGVVGNSDLESWTVGELERWLEDLNGNIPLSYKNHFANKGYLDDLRNYVADRRKREAEPLNEGKSGSGSSGSGGSSSNPPETSAVSALDEFLSKYGSSSSSYLKESYQAIIDKSQELQKTLSPLSNEYKQLQEVVDSYTEKIDKLNKTEDENTAQGKETTDYLAQYKERLAEINAETELLDSQIAHSSGTLKEYLQGIRDELAKERDELLGIWSKETTDAIDGLISRYGSLSNTLRQKKIAQAIQEVADAIESCKDPETKQYLEEIKESLESVANASNKAGMSFQQAVKVMATSAVDAYMDINGSLSRIWSNQAAALEEEMDRQKEAGELTVEAEEKKQSEINALKKKAFLAERANSIASATMSYAQGVMNIWKDNPWYLALPLTAILSASYGLQLAAINSQSYTPMATGGIVSAPTRILAGEAGPEAIIPLDSDLAADMLSFGRTGNGGSEAGGVFNLNITIEGNADAQIVYEAIERAQRSGYLPKWQYA